MSPAGRERFGLGRKLFAIRDDLVDPLELRAKAVQFGCAEVREYPAFQFQRLGRDRRVKLLAGPRQSQKMRASILRIGKALKQLAFRQGSSGAADRNLVHAGVGANLLLDDYLTPGGDLIGCTWHGALFAISNGACVGGPCAGTGLTSWPVEEREGMVVAAR